MELIKFKTDITTSEAISQVAPLLDAKQNISSWDIDTQSEGNILSVAGENLDPQQIENAVKEAGFSAEPLRIIGIGGEGL